MAKKSFLDAVDVPVPCSRSWDEMTGGEKLRFCANCAKDIHNISAMTRKEARKLLSESKENLCIRIEKDADGKIKTLKRQLHQITRHAPIAASVLSASLTFSALTHAQQDRVIVGKPARNVSAAQKQTRATISGTVTDPSGALVPGAAIRLINVKDNSARNALSNAEGFYEFKDVAAAVYRIEAEASGFKKFAAENIKIDDDRNLHLEVVLDSFAPTEYAPVAQEMREITSETSSVGDKIDSRQIENLPLPRGNVFVLGLFPGVAQKPQKEISTEQQNKTSQISFTIYAPNNEIIPKSQIELINQKSKEKFIVLANDAGIAEFSLIPRGKYDLEISANGFVTHKKVIQIKERIEPNVKITLKLNYPACTIEVN